MQAWSAGAGRLLVQPAMRLQVPLAALPDAHFPALWLLPYRPCRYYGMDVRTAGTCAAKFTDTFCASGTGGLVAQAATGGPIVSVASDAQTPDVLVGVVGWSQEISAAYFMRITDKQAFLAQAMP